MIARFFGTAFMLLSLPGRMAQAADLPADSPMRGAHGGRQCVERRTKRRIRRKTSSHMARGRLMRSDRHEQTTKRNESES